MDGDVRTGLPMSTMENKDLTTGNGSAPAMEDMENPNVVDGMIALTVTLPGGKEVTATVDASLAVMDLLVHVAAKNRLSPSSHEVKAPSPYPGEDPIKFKPNTQVKDLGVSAVEIVPKKAPESKVPHKKPVIFEKTVRLTVRLSKNKKFVLRVNPEKALCELLPKICEEHGVDPFHCTLRLISKPEEDIDLFKSLNAYNLPENELLLIDLRAPVPQMPVKEEKPKDKKKKSVFGFRSSTKKKHKGENDTDSVKQQSVRLPPPSSITTESVKSSPAPSPQPPRPSPPPPTVVHAVPVIDGSLLRKQRQQQMQLQQQSAPPPPPPPQPPARMKRKAPKPPGLQPGRGTTIDTAAHIETSEPPDSTEPPAMENEIKAIHIETVHQSPTAVSVHSNQSNHSSPLGDRIVIGQEAHDTLLDSNATPLSVSPQSSPPHGQTTTTVTTTPTSIHISTEPSSGTLKKRKAPPPPKPPAPLLKATPPTIKKGTPEKKKAPPQPLPRVRRTSTGSTVSAGSDSSGANIIDSSPAATPPTTLDRPPRPSGSPARPKDAPPSPPPPPSQVANEDNDNNSLSSEGVGVRKRPPKPPRPQSYAGEVLLAESTRTRRPCSFIAPPPPEEPPSPETAPEDIDKLIQEGRIAIATTQRRDSVTDHPTTEDSYTASDRSTPVSSGHSASERSSIRGDDEEEDECKEDGDVHDNDHGEDDGEEILDMLNDVVKEQEENDALPSPEVKPEVSKSISGTVETSADVIVTQKEAIKETKPSLEKADQSDDEIELTEEEAKILAELEAEAEAEEEKEAREGESSATESEEIALKEGKSHILNQMMKLSLDNENSNDTVNYSPTSAPEQEMLEEKLISQLAYPIVRHSTPQVTYAMKSDISPEEVTEDREVATPEAESTESQQDEEREKETVEKVVIETEKIALLKDKKTIVVDVNVNSKKTLVKEDSVEKHELSLDESMPVKMDIEVEKVEEKTQVENKDVVQEEKSIEQLVKAKQEEHQTPQKAAEITAEAASDAAPGAAVTGEANSPAAKQLQEQYAVLQQQFAALQQQMINNQQQVLQQQQQQIAAAVSGTGQPLPPTTAMTNPMMMPQAPMMMPAAMTPQMLMQQQMMMQYQMGMPQQYMVNPQMMTVPQPAPTAVALSPPQVAVSPQQTVTSPPQPISQPLPGVSTSDPQPIVQGSSPPRQTQEPEVLFGSPPEVVFKEELKAKNRPYGIPLDSQGNISKKSFTLQPAGQKESEVSSTWLGSRHRSTSNPADPENSDQSKVVRSRAGTLEVAVPKNKKIPVFPPQEPAKTDPVPHQEQKIVIIDASKPKEEEQPKQVVVEEKPKRDIVIVSPQPPVQTIKPKETKPARGIVIIESTPKPVDISKPKEEKPKKDIVIIESTPKPSETVPIASHTEEAAAPTASGRQGYSQYASHGGIPRGRQSHKGGSEVQIRHLHSAREDELSATRESASVSRLRAMFGGADKS